MFRIKSYGKSEFAWLMFPKMRDPNAAQDKLLRWIKKDPRLHKRRRNAAGAFSVSLDEAFRPQHPT